MQLTSTQINIFKQLMQCMLAHHIVVVAFDAKCEQKQCETRQFARENYFGESVWCDFYSVANFYIKRVCFEYTRKKKICLKCVLCVTEWRRKPQKNKTI